MATVLMFIYTQGVFGFSIVFGCPKAFFDRKSDVNKNFFSIKLVGNVVKGARRIIGARTFILPLVQGAKKH